MRLSSPGVAIARATLDGTPRLGSVERFEHRRTEEAVRPVELTGHIPSHVPEDAAEVEDDGAHVTVWCLARTVPYLPSGVRPSSAGSFQSGVMASPSASGNPRPLPGPSCRPPDRAGSLYRVVDAGLYHCFSWWRTPPGRNRISRAGDDQFHEPHDTMRRDMLRDDRRQLPKPAWLPSPGRCGLFDGATLAQGKEDAVVLALRDQEEAGIEIVTDGEQTRRHFVWGSSSRSRDRLLRMVTIGIRADRYRAEVPTVVGPLARRGQIHSAGRATPGPHDPLAQVDDAGADDGRRHDLRYPLQEPGAPRLDGAPHQRRGARAEAPGST